MALRLANKINRSIIQNLGKIFYTRQVDPIVTVRNYSEDTKIQTATKDADTATNQVYRPHMPTIMNSVKNSAPDQIESEADIVQKNLQIHHLQPALLPEYYKPPIDIHVGTFPKPPEIDQPQSQYRQFEKSTTYKSVKLPLRKPKLASPFPDPVKVMPSDTMSDLEKADQKVAEARVPKNSSTNEVSMNFSPQFRTYSSDNQNTVREDSNKCKKKNAKKTCPDIKGPCTPPEAKTCDRDFPFIKCKKKDAPYPSYSEYCHTIAYEHPSECKMCPWKPTDHPSFKPPKKKYHTSSAVFSPRKGLNEKTQLETTDRKSGWVEKEKCTQDDLFSDINNISAITNSEPIGNYIHCKKPCKRPVSKCKEIDKKGGKQKGSKNKSKKSKKSDKKQKRGKKSKKPTKSKRPQKKAAVDNTKSWITIADAEPVREFPSLFSNQNVRYWLEDKIMKDRSMIRGKIEAKNKKKDGIDKKLNKRKCKKLPPAKCRPPPPKKIPGTTRNCPKKKKLEIDQCPGEPGGCETATTRQPVFTYLMSGKKKKEKDGKCSRVELGVCKEEEPEDKCGTKRRGKTRKCPSDLLDKKRKKPKPPRKFSKPAITPASQPSTSSRPNL